MATMVMSLKVVLSVIWYQISIGYCYSARRRRREAGDDDDELFADDITPNNSGFELSTWIIIIIICVSISVIVLGAIFLAHRDMLRSVFKKREVVERPHYDMQTEDIIQFDAVRAKKQAKKVKSKNEEPAPAPPEKVAMKTKQIMSVHRQPVQNQQPDTSVKKVLKPHLDRKSRSMSNVSRLKSLEFEDEDPTLRASSFEDSTLVASVRDAYNARRY